MASGVIFWSGGGSTRIRTDSALLVLCILRDVVRSFRESDDDDYDDLITAVDEYMWTSISIDRFVSAVGGDWRLVALVANWPHPNAGDDRQKVLGTLPTGYELPAARDPERVREMVRLILCILVYREDDSVSKGSDESEFIMGID